MKFIVILQTILFVEIVHHGQLIASHLRRTSTTSKTHWTERAKKKVGLAKKEGFGKVAEATGVDKTHIQDYVKKYGGTAADFERQYNEMIEEATKNSPHRTVAETVARSNLSKIINAMEPGELIELGPDFYVNSLKDSDPRKIADQLKKLKSQGLIDDKKIAEIVQTLDEETHTLNQQQTGEVLKQLKEATGPEFYSDYVKSSSTTDVKHRIRLLKSEGLIDDQEIGKIFRNLREQNLLDNKEIAKILHSLEDTKLETIDMTKLAEKSGKIKFTSKKDAKKKDATVIDEDHVGKIVSELGPEFYPDYVASLHPDVIAERLQRLQDQNVISDRAAESILTKFNAENSIDSKLLNEASEKLGLAVRFAEKIDDDDDDDTAGDRGYIDSRDRTSADRATHVESSDSSGEVVRTVKSKATKARASLTEDVGSTAETYHGPKQHRVGATRRVSTISELTKSENPEKDFHDALEDGSITKEDITSIWDSLLEEGVITDDNFSDFAYELNDAFPDRSDDDLIDNLFTKAESYGISERTVQRSRSDRVAPTDEANPAEEPQEETKRRAGFIRDTSRETSDDTYAEIASEAGSFTSSVQPQSTLTSDDGDTESQTGGTSDSRPRHHLKETSSTSPQDSESRREIEREETLRSEQEEQNDRKLQRQTEEDFGELTDAGLVR